MLKMPASLMPDPEERRPAVVCVVPRLYLGLRLWYITQLFARRFLIEDSKEWAALAATCLAATHDVLFHIWKKQYRNKCGGF